MDLHFAFSFHSLCSKSQEFNAPFLLSLLGSSFISSLLGFIVFFFIFILLGLVVVVAHQKRVLY